MCYFNLKIFQTFLVDNRNEADKSINVTGLQGLEEHEKMFPRYPQDINRPSHKKKKKTISMLVKK